MPNATTPSLVRAEETFDGAGGVHLYAQSWRPPPAAGAPRATVLIVHGLKDHSARYGELAARLVARGLAVHAFDLRGHGRSEGRRVAISTFDDYLADLDAAVAHVRAREPGAPLFLFGHSMGGAIVTLYTIERRSALAGLVVHAGGLAVNAPAAKVFGVKVVAALAPNAGVFQLDLDDFSRDPEVVRAARADPLIYQPGAPARTGIEVVRAVRRIEAREHEIEVPLLALHGTSDKITAPEGSKQLCDRARSADKTLKLYRGLVHDLIHEPEKEIVLTDIVSWIDSHVPAPTP